MALDFPSTGLSSGQIYEGWSWTGSAWLFSGSAVGGAATTTTTTAGPTTTTTTTVSLIPVVQLTAITQNNEYSQVGLTGALISGSGITERGIVQTTSSSPTPPAYGSDYYLADSATSPFTKSALSCSWSALLYYRAYAINSYGTGYSEPFVWSHVQSNMISASRSGSTINCSCENRTGSSAALNSEVIEIGFLWNNTQSTFPTFESGSLGYAVAGSQLPTSPTNMTGTITGVSSGTGYNVRGYIKYSSGFYWYTLSTIWVAPVSATTTTTAAPTTTTTTTTTAAPTTTTTTTIAGPAVTTQAASAIGSSSATLNGTLVSVGGGTIGALGFVWGPDPNPTTGDNTISAANMGVGNPYSAPTGFGEMAPNTLYYARAYLGVSGTSYYGNQITFTTTS